MVYQWQCRPYRRRFKQAVQTSHGAWTERDGIILRLVDGAGNVGWGEIAPIPWFGSETIEQALEFCHQLPATFSDELIFSIPDALPCCQFAFESAWEGMRAGAIGEGEPQRRRDAQNQASVAVENSTLRPQSSDVAVPNSNIAAQSSAFRPQNSNVAVPNSTLQPQSWDIAVPNSAFRPQNSNVAAQNSDADALNATLRPQNSDIAVLNSDVAASSSTVASPSSLAQLSEGIFAVQDSKLKTQNSKLKTLPHTPHPTPHTLSYSALLPAGNAALHTWEALWEQGFCTFKWKIGVQAIVAELEIVHLLAQTLPPTAKLRLDANGGLSIADATQWLQVCDALADDPDRSITIEYIEQPLPVAQFQAMQAVSQHYLTPIALDESVATLQQLQTCYENGWRGIVVIKPAIVGSPSRLRQFCQTHAIDAVFSSAFETAIGRQAGLQLAAALGNFDRALGYGTTHWFDDAASDVEPLKP